MLCGGTGAAHAADDTVKGVFAKISSAFAEAIGANAADVSAENIVNYKSQVVAGMNFFIKIKVGSKFYAARVYRQLDGSVELADQKEIKADEEIAYF